MARHPSAYKACAVMRNLSMILPHIGGLISCNPAYPPHSCTRCNLAAGVSFRADIASHPLVHNKHTVPWAGGAAPLPARQCAIDGQAGAFLAVHEEAWHSTQEAGQSHG